MALNIAVSRLTTLVAALLVVLLPFPPAAADVVTGDIFADNTFTLFVNGRQVAQDPIAFTPHNTVRVQFEAEYPFVVAIRAEDHAHPSTGLEYNHSKIGDGGLIARFSNGIRTGSAWRCKVVSHGPIDPSCLKSNPQASCRVRREPEPAGWTRPDFDDRGWRDTSIHSASAVRPHGDFRNTDWQDAQFIWGADLELDNVVLCRLQVTGPGSAAKKALESRPERGEPGDAAGGPDRRASRNLDVAARALASARPV